MTASLSWRPTPPADISFEVYRDRHGHWCAMRADGKVCGTFLEREAALRFARRAW